MIKRALMSGLASGGAAVLDLRIVPMPVNGYMVRETNAAAAGLHVRIHRGDPRQISIEFFDERGIALTRGAQRKIENALYREDFRRADPGEVGQIEVLGQAAEQYAAAIARSVDVDVLRQREFRLVVDCAYGSASFLAPQLLGHARLRRDDSERLPRVEPAAATPPKPGSDTSTACRRSFPAPARILGCASVSTASDSTSWTSGAG